MHQAKAYLCELLHTFGLLSTSVSKLVSTYQHQPIGVRVRLGVLGDIPTWHPRSHYAKRMQRLRDLDDGKHMRVRIALNPFRYTKEHLV